MKLLSHVLSPSNNAKNWRLFIFILIVATASLATNLDKQYNHYAEIVGKKIGINIPKVPQKDFKLGLDLLGGSSLIYRANTDNIPAADQKQAVEGVKDVIERRVNLFGVSEPNVQTSFSNNEYKVIVELAGVTDINKAIALIGETPLLEFKEQGADTKELTKDEEALVVSKNVTAEKKANEIFAKVKKGDDFAQLAKENSDDTDSKNKGGDLGWITVMTNPQIVEAVKDLKNGDVIKKIIKSDAGYEIIKLVDRRFKSNPFDVNAHEKMINADHILICFDGADNCTTKTTKDEAYKKIKEIQKEVTINNFSSLAKKYSTEPNAATTGGQLGWFTKGQMLKPFEDTVFAQKAGTISYIVETKYGFHLIHKIAEKDIEEFNIARILFRTTNKDTLRGEQNSWQNTKLTGKYLKRASVQFEPNSNAPEVSLEFDKDGADLFAQITEKNIGKQVAIFLDGYAISAPVVNGKITGGKAVISGKFNIKEANLLAQRLNAGALPVPITLINQKTIGASLGKDSVSQSLRAGVFGLILVALFMIIYYRLPGLAAVVALLIYGTFMLSIFKFWPITLTLSGIAGFILSLGIAVDANVLIFERLKEELRNGSPLSLSIQDGFKRAWPSIRDGNVSTLLTCFILIQFTTSTVKGFALTLSLGIIISMFSAVIITKNILSLINNTKLRNTTWLWGVNSKK